MVAKPAEPGHAGSEDAAGKRRSTGKSAHLADIAQVIVRRAVEG